MKVIEKIKSFFHKLNIEQLSKHTTSLVATVIVITALTLYISYSKISSLQTKSTNINNARKTARGILSRQELVKTQKAEVDEILSKEKNFKIKSYFDSVVSSLNLYGKKQKEAITTEELPNKFTEVRLTTTLININTQELCSLLQAIERKTRVYTKRLEINKKDHNDSLRVDLVIATLKPNTEAADS